MPPIEDDWSDSDDDVLADIETPVLLGIPDGDILQSADLNDAAVSRLGGLPAFIPSREPPFSSSHCKTCSNPMELLVQMWCPFEDSPMDRALYIWGCARAGCQGKRGSIRAWRGLRYNHQFAEKLAKKFAKRKEREEVKAAALADAERRRSSQQNNPFSMSPGASAASNPFGLGFHIFGEGPPSGVVPSEQPHDDEEEPNNADDDGDESDPASEESLIVAMASTTISDSSWSAAPSHPPQYLSTSSEYLPPPPKIKSHTVTGSGDRDKADGDGSWAIETYENSLDVDQVFSRFSKRVSAEPEQCVRYELNGTPLPFATDSVFESLFPTPPAPNLPVTKAVFMAVQPAKRTYRPTNVAPCAVCGSDRVFECQLVPNLINTLKPKETSSQKKVTDEERRKLVQNALKRVNASEKGGMEWGTCFVFSCSRDCCRDDDAGGEAKECWREEEVIVQWDV